jgi:hypothetical protein
VPAQGRPDMRDRRTPGAQAWLSIRPGGQRVAPALGRLHSSGTGVTEPDPGACFVAIPIVPRWCVPMRKAIVSVSERRANESRCRRQAT